MGRVELAASGEAQEGRLKAVSAGGRSLLLTRVAGNACAGESLGWVNPVAGLPLPAWSRALVAAGRKPAPLQTFTVTEADGTLHLES